MKKVFFLFCLLFNFVGLMGQGFSLIYTSGEYYFGNKNVQLAQAIGTSTNFEHFVRIDSQYSIGNETHFFNHPGIDTTSQSGCDWLPGGTSWLGPEVVSVGNGDWIFFNETGDSILFKTGSVSSWKMYNYPNGDFIEASPSQVNSTISLGIPDSVYSISLQTKTSLGQSIVNPLNGYQFEVSKTFGLFKTLDLSVFPAQRLELELEGATNPQAGINNPLIQDIYDLQIGDEIHIREFDAQTVGTGYINTRKIRRIVLARYDSPAQDTIVLQFEDLWHRTNYFTANQTTYHYYGQDTILDTIIDSPASFLNSLPTDTRIPEAALLNVNGSVPLFYDSRFNSRLIKSKNQNWGFYPTSNCYQGFSMSPSDSYDIWIHGLGGGYYFIDDFGTIEHKRIPVYFKKGTETWGIPYDISQLVGFEKELKQVKLKIFPNPASDRVKVMLPEGEWKLTLFDTFQRKVKTISGRNQGECEVELQGLAPGIYLLQAENLEGQRGVAKLLKQ